MFLRREIFGEYLSKPRCSSAAGSEEGRKTITEKSLENEWTSSGLLSGCWSTSHFSLCKSGFSAFACCGEGCTQVLWHQVFCTCSHRRILEECVAWCKIHHIKSTRLLAPKDNTAKFMKQKAMRNCKRGESSNEQRHMQTRQPSICCLKSQPGDVWGCNPGSAMRQLCEYGQITYTLWVSFFSPVKWGWLY